jgi:hypothetical protein
VWSCDACGRGFEDLVCLPAPQLNMQADGTSAKLAKIGPIRRAPFLWRAT